MAAKDPLVGMCDDRRRQAADARRRFEPDWYLNLAFFEGQQWLAYDGSRLFRPRISGGRLTLTDNRIQPIVRTEVAKLTKARPGWVATPRDGDDRSVQHALTGERLLEWGYDSLNFPYHRREALTWARICGAGFVKATWDPTIGDSIEVMIDAKGEPIRNPSTKRVARRGDLPEIEDMPGVMGKQVAKGDVRLDTRSPFDIYVDPLAASLDDARWIIDEAVRSPEYIETRYGKKIPADAPAPTGVVQSRLNGVGGGSGAHVGVRVFEMWEAPAGGKPGQHIVWAGGQILAKGDNPYGCIPYVMFPGVPVPGRFWPDAIVTQLRPIQARRNKLLSQIAEHVGRTANSPLLVDTMSQVKIAGLVGEQIHYQSGLGEKPQYLQPGMISQDAYQLLAQTESSLREISGQYEVSQGTVPSGVTAASAISLLQEQGDTRFGPDVEAMEIALGRLGQIVLKLMARFYTTERVVVVVGEDGVIDIDSFRSSVDFQVPDVKVQAGSTFPRSLAAKQAAIRDVLNLMLQYGVPVSADALSRTLRDMQVGGLEKIVQSFTSDQAEVAREHVDFLRGIKPVRNPLVNNDEIHLAGHKDFAKSARFRALPKQQQDVLLQHIDETEQAMQAKAAASLPPLPAGAPGGAPAGLPAPPDALPVQPPGDAIPMLESDPLGGLDPSATV